MAIAILNLNHLFKFMILQLSGGGSSGKDPRKFIQDIKNDNLGQGEKPDYFTSRCWVSLPPFLTCVLAPTLIFERSCYVFAACTCVWAVDYR